MKKIVYGKKNSCYWLKKVYGFLVAITLAAPNTRVGLVPTSPDVSAITILGNVYAP
jgi:hypothetical protein